ncbi:MAG: mechanosensitive ion channel family protein [Sandaracinus sp.]|nr:mechanosensitive ion channel family protein [Myxococcales bacterium]MCB9612134.1 mechanosensitive ion channel family protein [Sandaracinus sp.]
MSPIGDRLSEFFSPTRIGRYLAEDLVPNVVVASIVLLSFWLLHRVLDRILRLALERSRLDVTAVVFVRTVFRYALFTVAIVTALAQVGVDVSSLLTSLGIAGLTIGFAARDVLSNVISGLFIFWDRPFVIGDLVEVGGDYGRVAEITMRSTRVVTPDGRMLAIPNTEIVSKRVASYTNFPHLRLDLDFTIDVTESLAKAREVALSVVEGDGRFLAERPAKVHVVALNDYNVAMQLRVWLADERAHLDTRTELREKLFEALRAAGVAMPFETLDVRVATGGSGGASDAGVRS